MHKSPTTEITITRWGHKVSTSGLHDSKYQEVLQRCALTYTYTAQNGRPIPVRACGGLGSISRGRIDQGACMLEVSFLLTARRLLGRTPSLRSPTLSSSMSMEPFLSVSSSSKSFSSDV
jgi:hypothetical protein